MSTLHASRGSAEREGEEDDAAAGEDAGREDAASALTVAERAGADDGSSVEADAHAAAGGGGATCAKAAGARWPVDPPFVAPVCWLADMSGLVCSPSMTVERCSESALGLGDGRRFSR